MTYPEEVLSDDYDDGTMPDNVSQLRSAVIGRKIVSAGPEHNRFVITLDDGTRVSLADTNDCCAFTELEEFWLDPTAVDHMILGVGTTEGYTVWHIYADYGDILTLQVRWSCGNPFYYGYGFSIKVVPA